MNKGTAAAVALYLLCSTLLGFQNPGLHNDEAVFYDGAVQALGSGQEPSYVHDPWSGITIFGRWWPIMTLPYAGAVRSYLAILPFAVFGPGTFAARSLMAVLGAFTIWALSVLIRRGIDSRTATLTSFLLAIHPAYLITNLYNQGVAEWMVPFGVLCIALAWFLKAQTYGAAFWLGVAMGFGVWTRANIAWLLGSALLAGWMVYGKRLLIAPRLLAAMAVGGLIGGAPLLWYEIRSGGATFAFMRSMANTEPLARLLGRRFEMLSQIFILSGADRAIWLGPALPVWQVVLFCSVVTLAVIACLLSRDSFPRVAALTFLLLLLCMLLWRLNIADQHLIALVPLAALLVAITAWDSCRRWPAARYIAAAIGILYLGCSLQWQLTAARELRSTGGLRLWSKAIDPLCGSLLQHYPGRRIKALDWGFHHSLFVLSNGKITTTDLFSGATRDRSASGKAWGEEIARGDVYLAHSPGLVEFPAAQDGFFRALAASGFAVRRYQVAQSSGAEYAEVLEILY